MAIALPNQYANQVHQYKFPTEAQLIHTLQLVINGH